MPNPTPQSTHGFFIPEAMGAFKGMAPRDWEATWLSCAPNLMLNGKEVTRLMDIADSTLRGSLQTAKLYAGVDTPKKITTMICAVYFEANGSASAKALELTSKTATSTACVRDFCPIVEGAHPPCAVDGCTAAA